MNVTSALGRIPKESAPVYCATKAALSAFTTVLRDQLRATPIKVFELIPALVETEMTQERAGNKMTPDELTEEFLRCFAKNNYEIRIGKVKLLYVLHRLVPSLARSIIRKG